MREIEKFYNSFKLSLSEKDVIKKCRNEYLSIDYEGAIYIRNFCTLFTHVDIDEYFFSDQLFAYNSNAYANKKLLISNINIRKYQHYSSAIIICSSKKTNEDVFDNNLCIGVNESLKYYAEKMHIYACNNPLANINQCFPNKNIDSWPEGLFAYRVNPSFIKMYKGNITGYNVPKNINRSGLCNVNNHNIYLEDHRSIILTVFNLLYCIGIRNIILVNFENYIEEERPGAVYIKEGVYMYPQQIIDLSIINAGAYWLNKNDVNVFTTNKCIDFASNIKYIEDSKIISGEF